MPYTYLPWLFIHLINLDLFLIQINFFFKLSKFLGGKNLNHKKVRRDTWDNNWVIGKFDSPGNSWILKKSNLHTMWRINSQINGYVGYPFVAACNTICLIFDFLPHQIEICELLPLCVYKFCIFSWNRMQISIKNNKT